MEASVSGEVLRHRAVHRFVRVTLSHEPGTVADHLTRSFQVNRRLSKLELKPLVGSQWLAKLFTLLDVIGCEVDALCSTAK